MLNRRDLSPVPSSAAIPQTCLGGSSAVSSSSTWLAGILFLRSMLVARSRPRLLGLFSWRLNETLDFENGVRWKVEERPPLDSFLAKSADVKSRCICFCSLSTGERGEGGVFDWEVYGEFVADIIRIGNFRWSVPSNGSDPLGLDKASFSIGTPDWALCEFDLLNNPDSPLLMAPSFDFVVDIVGLFGAGVTGNFGVGDLTVGVVSFFACFGGGGVAAVGRMRGGCE